MELNCPSTTYLADNVKVQLSVPEGIFQEDKITFSFGSNVQKVCIFDLLHSKLTPSYMALGRVTIQYLVLGTIPLRECVTSIVPPLVYQNSGTFHPSVNQTQINSD